MKSRTLLTIMIFISIQVSQLYAQTDIQQKLNDKPQNINELIIIRYDIIVFINVVLSFFDKNL